jgi:glycosyltransferase involved in cell wall biosynthesis
MSTPTALVILTYVDRLRPPLVRRRLRDALASLERTCYHDPVIIVDDGSNCEKHLRYLDRLARAGRYEVIRRPANGGPSRAKNTSLRVLAHRNVEIGFLAEDDILFHDGWDQAYVAAMRSSGIQHFSWFVHDPTDLVVACNGCLVTATSGLLGLLLSLTQEVLNRVGGFKILPHRYGYEHIQWTYRNILAGLAPFPCDIVDSHKYIEQNALPSSFGPEDVQAGTLLNRPKGWVIDRLFEPLED